MVLAVQPFIQEEVSTLFEIQATVTAHEALRVVELVPRLDNGSPVVGDKGTGDWQILGQASTHGLGKQKWSCRGAGGQTGYSHDPVAAARALW